MEKTTSSIKVFNTYNAEGAKKLLADAGFKDVNNDGFVDTPSGKSFELMIQSPNGWTDFNNTVQLAVEQLNEVGIKGKLVRQTSCIQPSNAWRYIMPT